MKYLVLLLQWLLTLPVPSLKELIERDLDEARRDHLRAAKNREDWAAAEAKLRGRIERLLIERKMVDARGGDS